MMIFIAIFWHKDPEGVPIASLYLAEGRPAAQAVAAAASLGVATLLGVVVTDQLGFLVQHGLALAAGVTIYVAASNRSEEHTSELQSQSNLVCPLLPEKKNDD